jgi:hypothetical protein
MVEISLSCSSLDNEISLETIGIAYCKLQDSGLGLNTGNEKRNRTVKLFEFPYKVEAVVHACIPGF